MFKSMFKYEFSYWLKSPITYIFGFVFFGIALAMMLGTGGFFDGVSANNNTVRFINSAHEIIFIFQYFNKLLLFMIPVFFGNSIYKDYQSGVFKISYSFPINKWDYLLSKFLCSLLFCFGLSLFVAVGLMVGEFVLGHENPKIAPFQFSGYFISYLLFVLPNLMIFGGLVFVIVGISRNIYGAFISLLIFFLFQILVENIFHSNGSLMALLDPFGQDAFLYTTRNWDLSDQNIRTPSVLNYIGLNRLFWLSISSIVFLWFCNKFDFQYNNIWSFKGNLFAAKKKIDRTKPKLVSGSISKVSYDHSLSAQVSRTIYLAFSDLKFMLYNWMFIVFSLFGLLTVVFILLKVTNSGEFNLLPITRVMLSAPLSIYALVLMLATFVYAGLLVHRGSMRRMNLLMDVTTTSNWSFLTSKIIALGLLQCCFLVIMLVCGIGIQIYNGYFHFEISQYFLRLFGISFPVLFIWGVLSIFVHDLMPNLYVGLFILVLCWMGFDNLDQLGLSSKLLRFNAMPSLTYDDFNGFGNQLSGRFLVCGYWLISASILLLLTHIFWKRGIDRSIVERSSIAISRLSRYHLMTMFVLLSSFCFLGFKIYEYERIDHKYGEAISNMDLNEFKARFGKYKNIKQPKIKDIKMQLNIYPEQQTFDAMGSYVIVNREEIPLDTLLIKTGFDEVTSIQIEAEHKLIESDSLMKYYAYELLDPLSPGDSLVINFKISSIANTLFTRNSSALKNGTYIKQDILPRLQYFFDDEIRSPEDTAVHGQNNYSKDADGVMIETTIVTSGDQVGIAPGELISETLVSDRKSYTYKTKRPVKFNFSFHSGKYELHTDVFDGIPIEVFTHPDHNANVGSMIAGVKASLLYNTRWFGNYPHDKIRIIEFPHTEESYAATLMSNNVPSSEMLFIINEAAMKDKINLPFYVMAHEMTHEWFGNQLMPAKALGAKMLTESITEYLSLRIYEDALGEDLGKKFLDIQHKRYLQGHRKERDKEMPLNRVKDEQQYIAYGKGAIAFNSLAHYIGENRLNDIINQFLDKYRNRHDSYPTTLDFLEHLKTSVDGELHGLISKLFERVVLEDVGLKVAKLISEDQISLTYVLNVNEESPGKEIDLNNQRLQIAMLNAKNEVITIEEVRINPGEHRITLNVPTGVKYLVADPNRLLMDPNVENNKMALEQY